MDNYSARMTLELVDRITTNLIKIEKQYKKTFTSITRTLRAFERGHNKTFATMKRDMENLQRSFDKGRTTVTNFSVAGRSNLKRFSDRIKTARQSVKLLNKDISQLKANNLNKMTPNVNNSRSRLPSRRGSRNTDSRDSVLGLVVTAFASSQLLRGFTDREPLYREVAKPGDFDNNMMTYYRRQAQKQIASLGVTMEDFTSASTSLLKAGVGSNMRGLDKVNMILEMSQEIVKTSAGLDMSGEQYSDNMTQLAAVLMNQKNPLTGKKYGLDNALTESLKAGARINYLDDILMGSVTTQNLNQMMGVTGGSLVQAGFNPAQMLTLLGVNKQTVSDAGRAAHGIKNLVMEFQKGGQRKPTREAFAMLGMDADQVKSNFNKDAYGTLFNFFEKLNTQFDDSAKGREKRNEVMIKLLGDQSIYVAGLVSNYEQLGTVYEDLMDKEKKGLLDKKLANEMQRNLDLTTTKVQILMESVGTFGEEFLRQNQYWINPTLDGLSKLTQGATNLITSNSAVATAGAGGLLLGISDLAILTVNRLFGTSIGQITPKLLAWVGRLWPMLITAIAPMMAGIQLALQGVLTWLGGATAVTWGAIVLLVVGAIASIVDILFFKGDLFVNKTIFWCKEAVTFIKNAFIELWKFVWDNFIVTAQQSLSQFSNLIGSKISAWWGNLTAQGKVEVDINDNTSDRTKVNAKSNSSYSNVNLKTGRNNVTKPA